MGLLAVGTYTTVFQGTGVKFWTHLHPLITVISSLCTSLRIKVFKYQIQLKSQQRFLRERVSLTYFLIHNFSIDITMKLKGIMENG